MRFHSLDHLRQIEANPLSFHHVLFPLPDSVAASDQPRSKRQTGDNRADPGPGFEEAFLNEMLDHFVRSIGMDP